MSQGDKMKFFFWGQKLDDAILNFEENFFFHTLFCLAFSFLKETLVHFWYEVKWNKSLVYQTSL